MKRKSLLTIILAIFTIMVSFNSALAQSQVNRQFATPTLAIPMSTNTAEPNPHTGPIIQPKVIEETNSNKTIAKRITTISHYVKSRKEPVEDKPKPEMVMIKLISPIYGKIIRSFTHSYKVLFQFEVKSNTKIESCSLYLDSQKVSSLNTSESLLEVPLKISIGKHIWQVKCLTWTNHTYESEEIPFQIKSKSKQIIIVRDEHFINSTQNYNLRETRITPIKVNPDLENIKQIQNNFYPWVITLAISILLLILLIIYVSKKK